MLLTLIYLLCNSNVTFLLYLKIFYFRVNCLSLRLVPEAVIFVIFITGEDHNNIERYIENVRS